MPKHTRKTKQGKGICAYCGAYGEVTEDHVIPHSLWGGTARSSLPKVDVCPHCNNVEKSALDAYLRDLLVTDRSTTQHAIVQAIFPKFTRSVERNQSLLARDLQDHGKVVMTQRPPGLLVLTLVAEEAEKRTREGLSFIVRGLHQYYLDEPLPKDASFKIWRLRAKMQIEAISREIASFAVEYHKGACEYIDDGSVFSCSYVELIQQDHTTLWQLNFYSAVIFVVATNLFIRGT